MLGFNKRCEGAWLAMSKEKKKKFYLLAAMEAAGRGWLARRRHQTDRLVRKADECHDAALLIQAWWHGRLARRRTLAACQAVRGLQSAGRGWLMRRHHFHDLLDVLKKQETPSWRCSTGSSTRRRQLTTGLLGCGVHGREGAGLGPSPGPMPGQVGQETDEEESNTSGWESCTDRKIFKHLIS